MLLPDWISSIATKATDAAARQSGGSTKPKTGSPLAQWELPKEPIPGTTPRDAPPRPSEWVPLSGPTNGIDKNDLKVENGQQYVRNPVDVSAAQAAWDKKYGKPDSDGAQVAQRYEDRIDRMKALGLVGDDLGMKAGALTTVELPKTQELNREAFESLSPRQQRAVEFNTMLSDAVKRDVANQDKYKPDDTARKTYDHLVSETFGSKDRGADFYAPETMAVLQQLHLKDTAGDLDDYLGMKVTITTDDIKALDDTLKPSVSSANAAERGQEEWLAANPNGANKLQLQSQITNQVDELTASLAKGNKILQSFGATARLARGEYVQGFGGLPGRPYEAPGFDTSTKGGQFISQLFDGLTQASPEKAREGLGILASEAPEQTDNFWAYVNAQLENADRYDLKLGTGGKTAEEMRKLLGLKE